MKVTIHQAKNKSWTVTFKSRNGKIVFSAHGYNKRWIARRAARKFLSEIFWRYIDLGAQLDYKKVV